MGVHSDPQDYIDYLAKWIRHWISKREMQAQDVFRAVGIGRGSYYGILQGEQRVSVYQLGRFAEVLRIPKRELADAILMAQKYEPPE